MVCLSCTGKAVVARLPRDDGAKHVHLADADSLLALVFPDIHVYSVNANSTINITKAGCIRWADSISTRDFTPPRLSQRQ